MAYKPKAHQQPGWSIRGGTYAALPHERSRWEKFLEAENISEKDLKGNPKVLKFARENVDKCYVPTLVLKMFGMDYDL